MKTKNKSRYTEIIIQALDENSKMEQEDINALFDAITIERRQQDKNGK
jgi:hypothetical protein